jgi:hypothetical protein
MPQNQQNKKPRMSIEQRTRRRNQIVFLVFSAFLILSMLISLVKF